MKQHSGVKIAQVYRAIQQVENDCMITKEEAACLLAHKYKIPLKKYFGEDVIRSARTAVPSFSSIASKTGKKTVSETKKTVTINIDKTFQGINEPLLPSSVITDARKMAEYYPLFYVFENSIRNFINLVLVGKYGKDWWNVKITGNNHLRSIDTEVQRRKNAENEHRFHGKRGAHEIYYTDLEHLKKIIEHYFPDFKPVLNQEKSFYEHMLRTINLSRRIIAHNNPLNDRDFNRIRTAFADWCDQLDIAKGKLGGGQ